MQRALGVTVPRIQALALAPEVEVCPTWVAEDPVAMTGIEAFDLLVYLHMRARAMLGRTRRMFWVPGGAGRRSAPT